MPRKPNTPCVKCGKLCWPTKSRHEVHHCRSCRAWAGRPRAHVVPQPRPCIVCTAEFTPTVDVARFCSQKCHGASRRIHGNRARKYCAAAKARHARMSAADGLNTTQRSQLRDKWKRQGRTCAYCPKPGVTLDHVIPLVLGGTNFEGNLVPCCISCNSSKSDRCVMEWRLKRRVAKRFEAPKLTPIVKPTKAVPLGTQQTIGFCVICNGLAFGRKFCNDDCAYECNKRQMRDNYRAKVGLPVDPSMPTKAWQKRLEAA